MEPGASRAGAACVFLKRGRVNSDVRRAHLSVLVTNSLRKPAGVRHIDQIDPISGRHVDVGGADLLPKRGGGGELAP